MAKSKPSRRAHARQVQKLPRQEMSQLRGREIWRREERLRIAPKHPGMGRR